MSEFFYMSKIGFNDEGFFVGEGDNLILITPDEIDALHFANSCSQALVDAFANVITNSFSAGKIPSCFRQDLPQAEIEQIQKELPSLRENFPKALSALMDITVF